MKNVFFLFVLLFVTGALSAQSEKYSTSMKTAVDSLQTAQTPEDFIDVANTFGRIASAEPGAWLPGYYASYANLIAGFIASRTDMAKGQTYIDHAQTLLQNAAPKAILPADLSEIATLQAYIYIGKVTEDPMTKGQELSPMVFQELGKAAAMNPNNPRAPFLQGMYTLNMPEFYGGGAKNAKPFLEKAQGLFEADNRNGIRPNWGKKKNEELLKTVAP